jgi:aspartyl-tRNA(Asn)/glutamyl-tRNA(Gln) amidotransferase subunit C
MALTKKCKHKNAKRSPKRKNNEIKLTKKQIEHIAMLARLGLDDEEKKKFAGQLSSVLDYVNQLEKIDTKNIEPIAQITGLINVMAEDKVARREEKIARDQMLKNAPMQEEGCVKVKAVLE